MKALVTGAAGFLGSKLVWLLTQHGHEVVGLDRSFDGKPTVSLIPSSVLRIEADVRDAETVTAAARGCEVVFHCAAVVGVDAYASRPLQTIDVEQFGLRAVAEAALLCGARRLIYPSSSAVYGLAGDDGLLVEESPTAPVSHYGIAKRFNEIYLGALWQERGLSSTSLRIFNLYGPGQDERLVIPRFIRVALAGENIEIYGDGTQTRDFTYVDDVAEAAVRSAGLPDGSHIVNVSTGVEVAVAEVARQIITAAGSRSTLRFLPVPTARQAFEVVRSVGSQAKLKRLIGWVPQVDLATGLRRILNAEAS